MKKIISVLFVMMLVACSGEGANNNKDVIPDTENTEGEEKGVKQNIEKEGSSVSDPIIEDEPIEKFWEVYVGDEIIHAVSSEEKVYDFEKEAGPFEDALLESFAKKEDTDWTPYLASFTANINGQASEEYIKTMNLAYIAVLDGDLDIAIEQIEEAKKIRESNK